MAPYFRFHVFLKKGSEMDGYASKISKGAKIRNRYIENTRWVVSWYQVYQARLWERLFNIARLAERFNKRSPVSLITAGYRRIPQDTAGSLKCYNFYIFFSIKNWFGDILFWNLAINTKNCNKIVCTKKFKWVQMVSIYMQHRWLPQDPSRCYYIVNFLQGKAGYII